MRFRGHEYTGRGVAVALVGTGITSDDPRLDGATVTGWGLRGGPTGLPVMGGGFDDSTGQGTALAVATRAMAPDANLMGVRVMDDKLLTGADLMAAGIRTAADAGAQVICLALGTPNAAKARLLRESCLHAASAGAVVLAPAHPRGARIYPADLPEAVGVASHGSCPWGEFYFFPPEMVAGTESQHLANKFLTHGHLMDGEVQGAYGGSRVATAYLAGRLACLFEAIGALDLPPDPVELLQAVALSRASDFGYG